MKWLAIHIALLLFALAGLSWSIANKVDVKAQQPICATNSRS